jgi:hypothetical protein
VCIDSQTSPKLDGVENQKLGQEVYLITGPYHVQSPCDGLCMDDICMNRLSIEIHLYI